MAEKPLTVSFGLKEFVSRIEHTMSDGNKSQKAEEFPKRGNSFEGEVESTKMDKSATVRWAYSEEVPKYERYERRNTKITVHVPEDIEVSEGDHVKVVETRPISKTKSAVITEIIQNGDEQ